MRVEVECYADIAEVRIVERVEGVESFCVLFGTTVAAKQMSVEIYAYFRNKRMSLLVVCGGEFNACEQVLFAVGAKLAYRELAAGKNHRLGEILKQERQRRC